MKTISKTFWMIFILAAIIGCSKDDNGGDNIINEDNNATNIMADVPIPSSFTYKCENNCGNGAHRYYTTTGNAIDIANNFKVQLENSGWTIEDGPGGNNQGAGLEASKGAKYLDFNVGGGTIMNIDLSVWPSEPSNKHCDHCKVTGDDGGTTGGGTTTTDLMKDLPVLDKFLYQCENACGDGRHRYYITSGWAYDIASAYATALIANGWKIEDGPAGVALGAGVEASKNGKYLDFNVGGQSSSLMNVDISVWPSEPSNKNCSNCQVVGSGNTGDNTDPDDTGSGDLLSDVPHVYSLTPVSTNDCNGGKHLYYITTTSPQTVTPDYKSALEGKGWTVSYNGGGSSNGWGLTATKGSKYLYMNIGGWGTMHIDLCVWPSQPSNTDCDQDCDD